MANISFFFPKERKGSALGVNAGLGNLGVSSMQFLAPIIITVGILGIFGGDPEIVPDSAGQQTSVWIQNAAFIWVPGFGPLIAAGSLAAVLIGGVDGAAVGAAGGPGGTTPSPPPPPPHPYKMSEATVSEKKMASAIFLRYRLYIFIITLPSCNADSDVLGWNERLPCLCWK